MDASILSRNNVKVSGEGTRPIMFAHGFGCDQNMWRFVAPAFEKDYQVILFDFVGSGKSDLAAYDAGKYSSLRGYADDVLEICEALKLKNVIFVGHSVSSMIGVISANLQPQLFDRLIFVGPSPRYINDPDYTGGFEQADIEELLETMDRNYIGWSNFLAPAIMSNPDRPELAAELVESFCSTDPVIARKFAEVTFLSDNRQDIKKLKIPSLIMQCSEDMIAPLVVGEYLYKNTPGSAMKVLKATGHCPHVSHPEETIDVMKAYLSK
ncbi:alpha/beta hydrolase [Segetibacter sp. 3557_3]|uniref:alpha/beta fold hydrolase n=1 Tax=Segetibacter sp. 3557_3 TaxID=2547429 RepID=UPI0010588F77|nr:alpha/beta hydrolase [Segetibacter sp. 3557_3]TDH24615.1 alpha/beta hydrolase [Segetibacter sp. 3557_3]